MLPDLDLTPGMHEVEVAYRDRFVYPDDPWQWACDLVQTVDEASQEIRRFPRFEYLRETLELLQTEPLIAIPKSRRMFVSWLLAIWCVHTARYHPNHAILWQSEVEEKAAFAVDKRMRWVEDHLLARDITRHYATIKTSKGLVGRITYDNGSWILAVPQGADVFRSYTPSVLIMDECEFQPQSHPALAAAMPFAEKGAKIVLVSSSNGPGGPLAQICREVGVTRFKPQHEQR